MYRTLKTLPQLNKVVLGPRYYSSLPVPGLGPVVSLFGKVFNLVTAAVLYYPPIFKVTNTYQQKYRKQKTYIRNIKRSLDIPFVPVQPTFGPLFSRLDWEKDFKASLADCYKLYYGPSDLGKSLAIANALNNYQGVVHIDLRQKALDKVSTTIATAMGVFGDEVKGKRFLIPQVNYSHYFSCRPGPSHAYV
jgi:hypothetical protein